MLYPHCPCALLLRCPFPLEVAMPNNRPVRNHGPFARRALADISVGATTLAETTLACPTAVSVKAIVAAALAISLLGGGIGLFAARAELTSEQRPVPANVPAAAKPNSRKLDGLIRQLGGKHFAE